jgi:hypothetical protein
VSFGTQSKFQVVRAPEVEKAEPEHYPEPVVAVGTKPVVSKTKYRLSKAEQKAQSEALVMKAYFTY